MGGAHEAQEVENYEHTVVDVDESRRGVEPRAKLNRQLLMAEMPMAVVRVSVTIGPVGQSAEQIEAHLRSEPSNQATWLPLALWLLGPLGGAQDPFCRHYYSGRTLSAP